MKLAPTSPKPKTWQQQLNEIQKRDYGITPEVQKFQQLQTDLLNQRMGAQQKATTDAMRARLGITGMGGSGVGIRAEQKALEDFNREKEAQFSQLRGEQLQQNVALGEAARGREFQALQSEADRAINRDTLNFQKQLGLGYKDPNTGQWIKGTAQIANIELEESLRNDIVNFLQAAKDFTPKMWKNVQQFGVGIYGQDRMKGISDQFNKYFGTSEGSKHEALINQGLVPDKAAPTGRSVISGGRRKTEYRSPDGSTYWV